ncbi:hypothetical protein P152DRAFT_471863 [Eremomyces bilateralis CBS 781.70]|uniref:Uncharacterized protein n=1 Tax=Eremomyces bilateralis CBS 781.70 TaxID=1392243 RepID=A0A6G1GAX4_9PEZI|nr:uncharacterized protein P152DRAFT_471863 [Eremomyces bilateralis CBS 781.70]KAF1815247.1 hypothetical protein P152DRAFT_471863 [Eremomyces bilateralis CBS 781.70]
MLIVCQYIGTAPQLAALIYTAVAISLPFSALWAAQAVENHSRSAASDHHPRRPILWNVFRNGSVGSSKGKNSYADDETTRKATVMAVNDISA